MPDTTPALPAVAAPEWLPCLQDTCRLLWPPPAVISMQDTGGLIGMHRANGHHRPGEEEFALIPGLRRPPILVPADRRMVAAAVRYHTGITSARVRLAARVLAIGLASGGARPLLRGRVRVLAPPAADTIESYLSSVMSTPIRVSMQLGPARANRKPVLQMLDGTGAPAGFAKVGINPLTRSLVRAERGSLMRLGDAGLTHIRVPRVLHYGIWHGLDVLVLSALPAWGGHRPLTEKRLTAAVTELARLDGLQREPLAGSEYFRLLCSRLEAADDGPEREALHRALGTLAARAGETVLTFGCWHGDWAPWNMANTGRGLLVWDWERFTSGVPLGFDALHYWLQAEAVRGEPRLAADRSLDRAPRLLAPLGVPARQAQVTGILYLADLATRYICDRQAQAGARLGATGTWLVPAVARGVAGL